MPQCTLNSGINYPTKKLNLANLATFSSNIYIYYGRCYFLFLLDQSRWIDKVEGGEEEEEEEKEERDEQWEEEEDDEVCRYLHRDFGL